MFDQIRPKGFQVEMLHHAEAILRHDMPAAVDELAQVLNDIRVPVEELIRGGGGEGQATQRIRRALADGHGWRKHKFEIKKVVDGQEKESVSHEIDHVKKFPSGVFALEIEWNNKDPFFDRDLENFKRLHADGVISIGCIITRGEILQSRMRELVSSFARNRGISEVADLTAFYQPTRRQIELCTRAADRFDTFAEAWAHVFVADKFGEATTHWRKLQDRISRGVGNPCPLLLIGIPDSVVEA